MTLSKEDKEELLRHAKALAELLEKHGIWAPCLRDDLGDLISDVEHDELEAE